MGGLLAAGDQAAGCAWNLGWAGWAEPCLGGLLDGFHTHLGLRLGGEASLRLAYFETGLGLLDDLGPDASRRSGGLRGWGTSDGLGGWHSLRPVD